MTDLEEIARALDSKDPEERRQAVASLPDAGEVAFGLLVRALGDEDWRVRKEATAIAIAVGPVPKLVDDLVRVFHPGENVGLRNAAVEALAGFGGPVMGALGDELPKLDPDGRKLVVDTLAKMGVPASLAVLKRALDDDDPNVRAATVEAIASVGAAAIDEAVPLLERCLESDDRFLKLAALGGLNSLEVPILWTRIEKLLDDPILFRAALSAAGRSGNAAAGPRLVAALVASAPSRWTDALAALSEYCRLSEKTLDSARTALSEAGVDLHTRLLRATRPSEELAGRRLALVLAGALGTREAASAAADALVDDRVAAEAEEALSMIGPAAVGVLVARIRTGDEASRTASLDLIGRLVDESTHESAIEAVVAALDDESDEVVRAALNALSDVGDERCLAPVAKRLESSAAAPIRRAAATALGECARRHPDAARELVENATPESNDALAATVILDALVATVLGSPERDIAFLSDALHNLNTTVRRTAIDALAAHSSDAAVDAVAFALTDEEREVQLAAVRALGRLGSGNRSSGVERLLDLVSNSEDESLVAAAVRALGDSRDPRALAVLGPLARSGAPMCAVAAVEALGGTDDPKRIDVLIDALSHTDAEVVKASLRELGRERDPRVITHVGVCCDHDAWDVRRLAADLLGQIGGQAALDLLRSKLARESEELVKQAIVRSLTEIESAIGKRRTVPPPGLGSWRP